MKAGKESMYSRANGIRLSFMSLRGAAVSARTPDHAGAANALRSGRNREPVEPGLLLPSRVNAQEDFRGCSGFQEKNEDGAGLRSFLPGLCATDQLRRHETITDHNSRQRGTDRKSMLL
jgi:hypothetical protein